LGSTSQVVVSGSRYPLALATGRSEREAFGIELQGGLGKIFWCRDTTLRLYQKRADRPSALS
jgi:hypothetical protein